MASFNKVIMMGNLTRDPELTYLPSQTAVVEFSLASTRKYRGNDGQNKEDTCFIDCRMYGKRAEVINQYCKKGSPLMIEGRLQLDRWETQDGAKRSKHRIFVENFTFVGGGQNSGNQNQGQQNQNSNQQNQGWSNSNAPAASPAPDASYGQPMPSDDEIPF